MDSYSEERRVGGWPPFALAGGAPLTRGGRLRLYGCRILRFVKGAGVDLQTWRFAPPVRTLAHDPACMRCAHRTDKSDSCSRARVSDHLPGHVSPDSYACN
jgi:hypothetical protein